MPSNPCTPHAQLVCELAVCLAAAEPRVAVLDRRRKLELAAKLQQRWQRWELSNFDYLMQARFSAATASFHLCVGAV